MDFKWLIFLLLSQYSRCVCIFCAFDSICCSCYLVTQFYLCLSACATVNLFQFFPTDKFILRILNALTHCVPNFFVDTLCFRTHTHSHTRHSTTRALCLHLWNDEWINYAASQMHGNVLLLPFLRFHIGTMRQPASQPVSTLRFNRTIVELLNCFSFCQFVGCWLMAVVVEVMLLLVFLSFSPSNRETITSIVIVPIVWALAGKHHISFVLVKFQHKTHIHMKWNVINVNVVSTVLN